MDYYRSAFNKNIGNPKEIWKTINEIMSRKTNSNSKNISQINIGNNTLITDPLDIAEIMNKHFSEIGSNLSSSLDKPSNTIYDYLKTTKSELQIKKIQDDVVS